MSQGPEKVIRFGLISATVWSNQIKTETCEKVVRTVNLQRRYKAEDGSWKTKNSFSLADLPSAIAVLNRALEHVANQEADHES